MSRMPIKTTHALFITFFSNFNEIILDVITDCGDTKMQDSTTSPSNTRIKTESFTTNTWHEFSTSQPGLKSNIVLHDISIYQIDIECEPKTDYE